MSDNIQNYLTASPSEVKNAKNEQKTYPFNLVPRKQGDLKTRYRPQKFEEVAETCSIKQLRGLVDNPNASQVFLFEGPTGTGKTTCARIVAKANVCLAENTEDKPCLECKSCQSFEKSFDVIEMNVADKRKIDDMRALIQDMAYHPQFLSKKIYILDEVQQLTNDAQQLLLKQLEDPRPYVLVFLCTTNKQGLEQTLIDRAETITFHALSAKEAYQIIEQILRAAGKTADETLIESFYNTCHGSVRALLNNLQLFIEGGYDPQKQDEELASGVKEICQALALNNSQTGPDWNKVAKLLKKSDIRAEADKIRSGIEAYFRGCLLNGGPDKFGPLLYIMISGNYPPNCDPYNRLVLKCFQLWDHLNNQYRKNGR